MITLGFDPRDGVSITSRSAKWRMRCNGLHSGFGNQWSGSIPTFSTSPQGQMQMKLKPLGLFENRTQQAYLCMETHRITLVSAVNQGSVGTNASEDMRGLANLLRKGD